MLEQFLPSGGLLPIPDCLREKTFDAIKAKEFCVGLLENQVQHPWRGCLERCSASARMSVAGSLFLFRKNLPSGSDKQDLIRSHRARLCTDPRSVELPSGYLRHCRKVARECFPPGWDRGYQDAAWRSCPSVSACTEVSRSKGGARATLPDRSVFLRSCLREGELDVSRDVQFAVVEGGGKSRMVTVSSASQRVLEPLHKSMYNQLSSFPWLLRGEAKPSKFAEFNCRSGEVFVSGDYEAATDFLPIPVAEAFLEVLLQNSSWIPSSVGRAALASLRCRIHYEDCDVGFEQVCGQLMGNLLSFPLLCLQNYAAFRWVFPASRPVKINGDDIVFRCSREEFDRWAKFVGSVGLTLSRGKTVVSSRFFSVNSHFFRARESGTPRDRKSVV